MSIMICKTEGSALNKIIKNVTEVPGMKLDC